jgi:hypothetical protein
MYDSQEKIERLVRDFESCAIQAADFHHREHLIVTVWYLQTLSRAEVVERMRSGLLRFLDHHGVDRKKYSEEVTVFWVDAVATTLEGISADASLVDKCNRIVSNFSSTARTPASRVEDEVSLGKS